MYAESHNEVIIRDKYNLCILRFNDQGDTDIEVRNSKTIGNWEAEKKDTPSWLFTPSQMREQAICIQNAHYLQCVVVTLYNTCINKCSETVPKSSLC